MSLILTAIIFLNHLSSQTELISNPLCSIELINSESDYIIQGKVISSRFLDSEEDLTQTFLEIQVLKSIKGNKTANEKIEFIYYTSENKGKNFLNTNVYPIFRKGNYVEYRKISPLIEIDSYKCGTQQIKALSLIEKMSLSKTYLYTLLISAIITLSILIFLFKKILTL